MLISEYGKAGYEAHAKLVRERTGRASPSWELLPDVYREAWAAAASEVVTRAHEEKHASADARYAIWLPRKQAEAIKPRETVTLTLVESDGRDAIRRAWSVGLETDDTWIITLPKGTAPLFPFGGREREREARVPEAREHEEQEREPPQTSRLFSAFAQAMPNVLRQRVTEVCRAVREAARAEAEEVLRRHVVARTLPAQVRPEVAGPDGDGDEE